MAFGRGFLTKNNTKTQGDVVSTPLEAPLYSKDQGAVNSQDQLNFYSEAYPQVAQLLNIREWLSLKFTTEIFNGNTKINYYGDSKEIRDVCDEISKTVNIVEFAPSLMRLLVVYGMAPVGISLNEAGDIKWNVAQPFQTNYQRIWTDETYADLLFQLGEGFGGYFCRIQYDINTIKTTLVSHAGGLLSTAMPRDFKTVNNKTTAEIYKKYKIKKLIHHNTGIVPFVNFTFIPIKGLWGNSFGQAYSVLNIIQGLQQTINELYSFLNYELKNNRTLVFICLTTQQMQLLLKNKGYSRQLFQNEGIFLLPHNPVLATNSYSSQWYQVQSGDPKLETYMGTINAIVNFIGELFGFEIGKSNVMKTATESKNNRASAQSLVNFVRMWLRNQLKKLVIKSLQVKYKTEGKTWDNKNDKDIYIEVDEGIGYNDAEQIENSIMLIENGLSTRVRELMKLNNLISVSEAEALLKKIEADQDAIFERELKQEKSLAEAQFKANPTATSANPMANSGMGKAQKIGGKDNRPMSKDKIKRGVRAQSRVEGQAGGRANAIPNQGGLS